jgi:ABC-type microcin C transport system permease subunit YejB
MSVIARMTRSSLLEVMNLDYMRTARAEGLNERRIIFRHAMRNALLPVIAVDRPFAGRPAQRRCPDRDDLRADRRRAHHV